MLKYLHLIKLEVGKALIEGIRSTDKTGHSMVINTLHSLVPKTELHAL